MQAQHCRLPVRRVWTTTQAATIAATSSRAGVTLSPTPATAENVRLLASSSNTLARYIVDFAPPGSQLSEQQRQATQTIPKESTNKQEQKREKKKTYNRKYYRLRCHVKKLQTEVEYQQETIRRLEAEQREAETLRAENQQLRAHLAVVENYNLRRIYGNESALHFRIELSAPTQFDIDSPWQQNTASLSVHAHVISDMRTEFNDRHRPPALGIESLLRQHSQLSLHSAAEESNMLDSLNTLSTNEHFEEAAQSLIDEELTREILEWIQLSDPETYEDGRTFVAWTNSNNAVAL